MRPLCGLVGSAYCPGGCGPCDERGVSPLDDPLWAGGRCFGRHYIVVPVFEDCKPDLRRGVVAVCRVGAGGGVVVGGAEAGGAEGSVAGWCGGLFSLFPMARICRVILLRWGSLWACCSSECDVGVGVMFQGLAPFDGGGSRCAGPGCVGEPYRGQGLRWSRGDLSTGWLGPGGP